MKIKQKNHIRTERLVLKPYNHLDQSRLVELIRNEKIAATFMIPDYPTEQEYLDLADRLIRFSQVEDETHLEYGIYLDNTLIGFVNDCGFDEKTIEIGYVIHPDFEGHGYATEAVRAIMKELWKMGFKKITAGFFENNIASFKVMEKCGMHLVDIVEDEEYRGNTYKCYTCEIYRSASV